MVDVAPIAAHATAIAASTSGTSVWRRWPRNASVGTPTDTSDVTSARTEPASVAAIATTIASRCIGAPPTSSAPSASRSTKTSRPISSTPSWTRAGHGALTRLASIAIVSSGTDAGSVHRSPAPRHVDGSATGPVATTSTAPSLLTNSANSRCSLSINGRAAARTARSTRAIRSPTTLARNARSSDSTRGSGSGSLDRGCASRMRRRRRTAASVKTPPASIRPRRIVSSSESGSASVVRRVAGSIGATSAAPAVTHLFSRRDGASAWSVCVPA